MSKRSRHGDNSKRQQPTQGQRAQAHLSGTSRGKATRKDEVRSDSPKPPSPAGGKRQG